MNNWRWENPHAFGDWVDRSNPQTTSSGNVKRAGDRFAWYCSDDLRTQIEPWSCRRYKPGDFLSVRPLNSEEIIHMDDDDENWADPGAPSGGRSHPGDGNDNDDGECKEDMERSEQRTAKGKGTQDGTGQGKATENWKGKGKGKGKGNGNGKGIVTLIPGGDHISHAIAVQLQGKCQRQTWTWRANCSGYIWSRKHRPPCQFPQMMIPTLSIRTANLSQNMILLWICAWRVMWTHCTALD